MNYISAFVVFLLTFISHVQLTAQTARTSTADTSSVQTTVDKCLTDQLIEIQVQTVPGFSQQLENMNALIRNHVALEGTREAVTIPVVVHVIHQGGPENISDEQIFAGIDHLNDAFANSGVYQHPDGVATNIQFCLARQTPEGLYTNGITRTFSPLTEIVAETQDLELKNLVRWNTNEYLNIWLVKEITSLSMGPGIAGYAYFPTSQGQPVDGIVNEAAYFGSSPDNSKVHIHEAGHYLGLYHTFEGGCPNNDCQTDGDKVCDTPPDNSTAPVPCGALPNTCTTDADDTGEHNPFRPVGLGGLGDQPDHFKNYMDYGYQVCQAYFSQGQSDRMLAAISTQRAILLESSGCEDPCMSPIDLSVSADNNTIEIGNSVIFTSSSAGANAFVWTINGEVAGTSESLEHFFPAQGNYVVKLTAHNDDPNCIATASTTIHVTCPVHAEFALTSSPPFEPGEEITAVNTSINHTTSQWVLNGNNVSNETDWAQTFTEVGGHSLYLVAGNGTCADTSTTRFFQVGNCDLSGVTNDWVVLNNRIQFVAGEPILDPNSPIQDHYTECTSSISDIDGNLLLASDGLNVFDRDLNVMPNGSGLLGHRSATQSVIITPHPGNVNQYFVITNDALENDHHQNGLRYNIVDMTLNDGLGDVLPEFKNKPLLARGSEKLSATWHANGRDIWVGSGEYNSNAWYAFLIDSEGIHTAPVVSNIGTPMNNNGLGSMRFSNDGNRMAACMLTSWPWRILVADFDRETGMYDNPIELTLSTEFNQQPFSLAFSPDNSKLYVSFWQGQDAIFQYDLSQTTAAGIMASQYSLTSPATFCNSGHLVLASDGKIYVKECVYTGLSAIQNPNAAGEACDYQRNVISVGAGFQNNPGNSLPNMMQGFYLAHQPSIAGPKNICVGGESYEFGITFESALDSAVWTHSGPGEFISQNGLNTSTLISGDEAGVDTIMVTVHGRCGISHDTLVVSTNLPETIDLGDITYFDCDSVVLDPGEGFLSYAWSNDTYESTLSVFDEGPYSVVVKGASGCYITDSTYVETYANAAEVNLGPDQSMCEGQLIVLETEHSFANYLWQDGSTNSTLTAFSPGTYWVEVSNVCDETVGADTIHISLSDIEIDLNHLGESYVCSSELPFTLHAPEGYAGYFWNGGQSTSSIYIDSVGTYALTVVNAQGCVAMDTLWVEHCIGITGSENEDFLIFPNPADGSFSISGLAGKPGRLRMYSGAGQVVLQLPLQPDGDIVVKTSHLSEGIYVVEWMSGDEVMRRKVAVMR